MSRIGKNPIAIPQGVSVDIKPLAGGMSSVVVKKGSNTLERSIPNGVGVIIKNGVVEVSSTDPAKVALWGLSRTLIANMVQGLDKGYQKVLEINGVGFKALVKGQKLELNVGFSHTVEFPFPKSVQIQVENNTKLVVKSFDKEVLGQVCAAIRNVRPPEPYQGKGIKYENEHIRRKEGKTAGK